MFKVRFSLIVTQSSKRPAFFSFIRPEGGVYKLIFKHGDDLRQDQLVLQMVELMDVVSPEGR